MRVKKTLGREPRCFSCKNGCWEKLVIKGHLLTHFFLTCVHLECIPSMYDVEATGDIIFSEGRQRICPDNVWVTMSQQEKKLFCKVFGWDGV